MKVEDFVKRHGWEKVSDLANDKSISDRYIYLWNGVCGTELRRFVESYELVMVWRMPASWRKEYNGDEDGLEGAKMYLNMFGNDELSGEELERFKQAIKDVEACQSLPK
ncbi:TPA: hypothetical protein MW242_002651 [Acinetobacter baumannii]|nr:hypothetical protein [Acinetobacter baumannii]